MADFHIAHSLTSRNEGEYANNPLDNGGETYRGIARKFNPDWKGWAAVDTATATTKNPDKINAILKADRTLQGNVDAFYEANYWRVNRLGELTSQELANKLFDVGVNMGIGKASRMLQEALNLTNQNGRAYPDMNVDGIVGNMTIAAANRHPNPKLLLRVIGALQGERYLQIMRANGTQEVFANSWFSRI